MKVKTSYLLPALVALTSFVLSVQAQDGLPMLETQDPVHRELNLGEDKTLIYDHPSHLSVVKDSSQTNRQLPLSPAKVSKSEAQKNIKKEKEDEDVLSFNFLYYMLQKFKMSDLVDQE
jgi:hypothetical protein